MHWPWPVNGHPHQDAGCQRSHFKPRKSHIHPGAGWFWPKLGTRDGIHWASGFFLLSPPRPFWGYDRCRVSSPLQCVRPESSPGQTMGHKKRRKARKKHKYQTRHGVENVKRKNNPAWARRHDEETQSQNGQVPPGFLTSSGGLGAWGGGTDGTNGTYRLLLTMGLRCPVLPPEGPCNGRSRRQKSGSYIICAGLLCATAILHGRLLFCSSSSSFWGTLEARGTSASQGVDPFIIVSSCLPRETSSSLCSSFVPCGFSTPSTTTPTTPPRVESTFTCTCSETIQHLRLCSSPVCDLPPVPPSILPIVSVPLRSLALRLATLHLSSRLFSEQARPCRSSGSCTSKRVDLVFLHHSGTYFRSGHV